MRRVFIYAALFAASMVVACAPAGNRQDRITCYHAGAVTVDETGSVDRLGDGEYQLSRKDGTRTTVTGDCVVDWQGAPSQLGDD